MINFGPRLDEEVREGGFLLLCSGEKGEIAESDESSSAERDYVVITSPSIHFL